MSSPTSSQPASPSQPVSSLPPPEPVDSNPCPLCGLNIEGDDAALQEHVNTCLDEGEQEESKRFAQELYRNEVNDSLPSSAVAPPLDEELGPAERMIRELELNDAALAAALSAPGDVPSGMSFVEPSLKDSLSDSAERVFPNASSRLASMYDAVDALMLKKVHICSQLDLFSSNIAGHGWDCGFRNIQIFCSSLFYDEENKALLSEAGLTEVPSIPEIAGRIEEAWKRGFDAEGAANFNGRLLDKEVWIGATETFCLFRSMNVAVNVKDFETPTEVEKLAMFEWIFDYFEEACRGKACSMHRWSIRSFAKKRFVAPLFCQWQGHSVTIAGAEKTMSGEIFLILLDPSHGFYLTFVNSGRLRGPVVKRNMRHEQLAQPRFQVVYIVPKKSSTASAEDENRPRGLSRFRPGGPS